MNIGLTGILRKAARDFLVAASQLVQRGRTTLLVAAVITLLEVLSQTPLAVAPASRGLVYVVVVAMAAAVDGLRAALVASLIAVAYAAYAPYLVGGHGDPRDLFILVFSTVVVGIVVGGLHDRIVAQRTQLREEKERLQKTVAAQAEFMNDAAHELRTPITVVHGYLSMLRDGSFGPSPPRWNAIIEVALRKSEELAHLVEQLLLSARLEARAVEPSRIALDVRDAVREAVERADPRATLLGADLSYQVPSRPVTVAADPEHVATILDNLINNALSYSDQTPRVRVIVVDEGDAKVLVEDRGRGIPDDMRERIFDRFFRVLEPNRPASPGAGLGLSISRDLAARQGGSLSLLRSEPGAGSVFVLRLLHQPPQPSTRPERPGTPSGSAFQV